MPAPRISAEIRKLWANTDTTNHKALFIYVNKFDQSKFWEISDSYWLVED